MRGTHSTLRRRLGAVIAALLVAAGGCGRLFRRGGAEPEPAVVVFANQSLDQASLYAVLSGGSAVRIGTVQPGRTDTLRLPASVVGPAARIDFVARLLARSHLPRTGPVTVYPGDWLAITLPPTEDMLSVLPAQP